jgi:hypothetical protein
MLRCAATTLAALFAAGALSACHGAAASPGDTPAPHAVRYTLAWATPAAAQPVAAQPAMPGWETTSDLGYRVRVTRGWLTSYSMELVECPKSAAVAVPLRQAAEAWSLLEAPAWAGHLSGTPNPAAIRPMQVESLTETETRDVGRVVLQPQAYCQVHYLAARAGPDAIGLPKDFDMLDTTLHVEGSYRAPGAEGETPFTIHTASAYGQLFDHLADGAAVQFDSGRHDAHVIVRRDRARLFDGVDFAKMAERQQGLQALKALVDHVHVELLIDDAAS